MTVGPTHYEVLGVPPDADALEIRTAWRRLARQSHPDVNVGDDVATARFRAAVAAYRILGQPERRSAYDRELGATRHAAAGTDGRDTARPRGRIPDRAICLEMPYRLNLYGGVLRVPIPGVGRCEGCAGRAGTRQSVEPCERCGGCGFAEPARVHPIRLLPGALDGACARIPHAGWPGASGHRGDLVVRLLLADAPGVRREGADLFSEARVRRGIAHRGGFACAPGAEGPHRFRIDPRTMDGTRFEFAGLGLRHGADAPRGRLTITVRLV